MQRDARPNFRESGGLIDLSARAKFAFSGDDRVRYLNGQVSNNVRKVSPQRSIYACVPTAKGKLSGDVFISSPANRQLLVDADASLREPLSMRLERYIVADDVTLLDVTDEFSLIHIFGCERSPLADFPGVQTSRFGKMGIDLFLPLEKFSDVWNSLTAIFPILGEADLETLRIEFGIPRWGFELTENTLPAEAGLDKTAIDFHKGCYIGQEVISRIESRGHVNRALTGFVIANHDLDHSQQDCTGKFIESQLFENEQLAGTITSAAFSADLQKIIALGYLKSTFATAKYFEIRTAANRQLGTATSHTLPFLS